MTAPFGWQHADLEEVKIFLQKEIARGVYKPIFDDGIWFQLAVVQLQFLGVIGFQHGG